MNVASNKSTRAIENQLSASPVGWSRIIAVRMALRSLPFSESALDDWLDQSFLLPLRALCLSWAATNKSNAFLIEAAADSDVFPTDEFGYNAEAYAVARAAALAASSFQETFRSSAAKCAASVAENAINFPMYDPLGIKILERQARDDILWIRKNKTLASEVTNMSKMGLWFGKVPTEWSALWKDFQHSLLDKDENYSVWIDWYERRVRGSRAAFDIPGDKYRKEDKEILRRLAEATDKDFWGKGHEYVNATLKGWLDEARARVAPEIISAEASGVFDISVSAEAELGPLPLPAQNTNALSFRADDEGRITIAGDALASQLRTDAGARDRHEEAVSEARHALGRCQGNNAAARLTGLLNNYLEAAGESVETAKPSLLVQRGERLRQELARYQAPDHMLPPVADDLLLDLKGWQSAHNMMVGLDPVLVGMDTAILGPDRQPSLIPPDEIRQKSEAADQAGILADEVVEVLIEAANLAPDVPEPGNRLTVLSNEMMRNLFIEAFSIALNHPGKTVGGVVAGTAIFTALGAGGVGAVSVMGSIKAAEYLVNHRTWILDRLGNTPTWQALITKLADWLEDVTPFERK